MRALNHAHTECPECGKCGHGLTEIYTTTTHDKTLEFARTRLIGISYIEQLGVALKSLDGSVQPSIDVPTLIQLGKHLGANESHFICGGTEFVSLDIDPVGHEGTIFRFAGSVYAVNETNQPDAVLQPGETA